ncbi:uncharacterized protein LOC132359220 isoform X3 [Balaenoptera ricei]|uniref:uncharacterized protein LOC132359220 isoform X3 n=1 Tax=Balaenoptera ricei TaxID=2746895 RepID=UPI0028BF2935|nr:uncharacterized protein LOC132359220 isoform X3 [Balaenoptera ricei]
MQRLGGWKASDWPTQRRWLGGVLRGAALYSKLHHIRRRPTSGCLTLVRLKLITGEAVTARLLCCKGPHMMSSLGRLPDTMHKIIMGVRSSLWPGCDFLASDAQALAFLSCLPNLCSPTSEPGVPTPHSTATAAGKGGPKD